MLIAIAFILMGVMFFAGLYVAGALGSLALILLQVFSDNPVWNIMGNRAWETNTNINLVAIPLFILMGEIVLRGGFADLMFRALSRWVDFIPGGLMHTNIASCAVFAACAGSSIATAATVSRVALPSFRAQGYQERLVVGSLAAGGTLGILIPPSILLVLYGLTVGESIGRLFLAGFIPGILLAGVFMLMIGIASVIWPAVAPRQTGSAVLELGRLGRASAVHRAHDPGAGIDLHRAGQHLFRLGHAVGGCRIRRDRCAGAGDHLQLRAPVRGKHCGVRPEPGAGGTAFARGARHARKLAGGIPVQRPAVPQLLPVHRRHDHGGVRFGRALLGDDPVHPDGGIHAAVRLRLLANIDNHGRVGRQLQPGHGCNWCCSWWCSTCCSGRSWRRTP